MLLKYRPTVIDMGKAIVVEIAEMREAPKPATLPRGCIAIAVRLGKSKPRQNNKR